MFDDIPEDKEESFLCDNCGEELALGSLYTTQESKMTTEEKINIALNAASQFSIGVRPPL